MNNRINRDNRPHRKAQKKPPNRSSIRELLKPPLQTPKFDLSNLQFPQGAGLAAPAFIRQSPTPQTFDEAKEAFRIAMGMQDTTKIHDAFLEVIKFARPEVVTKNQRAIDLLTKSLKGLSGSGFKSLGYTVDELKRDVPTQEIQILFQDLGLNTDLRIENPFLTFLDNFDSTCDGSDLNKVTIQVIGELLFLCDDDFKNRHQQAFKMIESNDKKRNDFYIKCGYSEREIMADKPNVDLGALWDELGLNRHIKFVTDYSEERGKVIANVCSSNFDQALEHLLTLIGIAEINDITFTTEHARIIFLLNTMKGRTNFYNVMAESEYTHDEIDGDIPNQEVKKLLIALGLPEDLLSFLIPHEGKSIQVITNADAFSTKLKSTFQKEDLTDFFNRLATLSNTDNHKRAVSLFNKIYQGENINDACKKAEYSEDDIKNDVHYNELKEVCKAVNYREDFADLALRLSPNGSVISNRLSRNGEIILTPLQLSVLNIITVFYAREVKTGNDVIKKSLFNFLGLTEVNEKLITSRYSPEELEMRVNFIINFSTKLGRRSNETIEELFTLYKDYEDLKNKDLKDKVENLVQQIPNLKSIRLHLLPVAQDFKAANKRVDDYFKMLEDLNTYKLPVVNLLDNLFTSRIVDGRLTPGKVSGAMTEAKLDLVLAKREDHPAIAISEHIVLDDLESLNKFAATKIDKEYMDNISTLLPHREYFEIDAITEDQETKEKSFVEIKSSGNTFHQEKERFFDMCILANCLGVKPVVMLDRDKKELNSTPEEKERVCQVLQKFEREYADTPNIKLPTVWDKNGNDITDFILAA